MDYLLHHLLTASAQAHPDRPAIVDGGRSISYGELEVWTNQLAHLLCELGVSRGARVGLYLEKSLESIVGLYGVLKAGAAYVPLDPQAPVSRSSYITRNCDIRCVLTGEEKAAAWKELSEEEGPVDALVVLNTEETDPSAAPAYARVVTSMALRDQPESSAETATIDLDLAYILYTSGSTGDPKGVMLSHLNALTFVNWAVDEFSVGADDRLSNHAPLHFDLSIFDIFAAAKAGACLVLVPPETSYFPMEVVRFIQRNEITIWYSVPSILSMLTVRGNLKTAKLPTLRTVLFAGEVFPTKYLRQLMQALPAVRFCNLYGPTETNVCTYYDVLPLTRDQVEPIPIGKAIANVEVFAVTDQGGIAGAGEIGELHVRGTTVMQGYWGDAERTSKGLFPNKFGCELHDPVYRTGDLARLDGDGNYRLLGRRDHQIKSRGYRIELGEIETALNANSRVVECAVIAIPDDLVTNRIKAYVVARGSLVEADLVRFCADVIPHYMLPDHIELCDTLPKTSTGKIDRQALSANAIAHM